jgi:hypothetical protein
MTEFKKRNLKKNKKRTMRRTSRGGGVLDKIKGIGRTAKRIPKKTINSFTQKNNMKPNSLRNKLGQSMKRRISDKRMTNNVNTMGEIFNPEMVRERKQKEYIGNSKLDSFSNSLSRDDTTKLIQKEEEILEKVKEQGFNALRAYALRKDLPIDILNDIEKKDQVSVFNRYNAIDFFVKNFNNGQKFNDQLTLLASLIRWQIVQNSLSSGNCDNLEYGVEGLVALGEGLQGYKKNQDGSIKLFKDLESQCNETNIPSEKASPDFPLPPGTKYKWSFADIGKDEIYLRREIGAFPFYNGAIIQDRDLPYAWDAIERKLESKKKPSDIKLRSHTNGLDILTYFDMDVTDLANIRIDAKKKMPGSNDQINENIDTYKEINNHILKFRNKDTKDMILPGSNKKLSFEITKPILKEAGTQGFQIYVKELFVNRAIEKKRKDKGDNQIKELYSVIKNKLDTYSLTQLYRLALGLNSKIGELINITDINSEFPELTEERITEKFNAIPPTESDVFITNNGDPFFELKELISQTIKKVLRNDAFKIDHKKREEDAEYLKNVKLEEGKKNKSYSNQDDFFINKIINKMNVIMENKDIDFYSNSFTKNADDKIWYNILCSELLLNESPKYSHFYNTYANEVNIKDDIETNKFFLSEYNKRLTPEYTVDIYNGQTGLMNEKIKIDTIIENVNKIITEDKNPNISKESLEFDLFSVVLNSPQMNVIRRPVEGGSGLFYNPCRNATIIRSLEMELSASGSTLSLEQRNNKLKELERYKLSVNTIEGYNSTYIRFLDDLKMIYDENTNQTDIVREIHTKILFLQKYINDLEAKDRQVKPTSPSWDQFYSDPFEMENNEGVITKIIKNISNKADKLKAESSDPDQVNEIGKDERNYKADVLEFIMKCDKYYQLFKLKNWIASFDPIISSIEGTDTPSVDVTEKIEKDSKILETNPNINWGDLNFPRSTKGGPMNPSNYKIKRVKFLADMRCGYCGEFKIGVFTPFVHKETYYDKLDRGYDPIYETNLLSGDQEQAEKYGEKGNIDNNPNNLKSEIPEQTQGQKGGLKVPEWMKSKDRKIREIEEEHDRVDRELLSRQSNQLQDEIKITTKTYMRPNVPYVEQGKSNYDVRGNRAGIRTEYKEQMEHARLTSIYYCKNKKCGVVLGMCNTGRNLTMNDRRRSVTSDIAFERGWRENKEILNKKFNIFNKKTGNLGQGKKLFQINKPDYKNKVNDGNIETNIKRINNLDVSDNTINCNSYDDNSYIKPDDDLCKHPNIKFESNKNIMKLAGETTVEYSNLSTGQSQLKENQIMGKVYKILSTMLESKNAKYSDIRDFIMALFKYNSYFCKKMVDTKEDILTKAPGATGTIDKLKYNDSINTLKYLEKGINGVSRINTSIIGEGNIYLEGKIKLLDTSKTNEDKINIVIDILKNNLHFFLFKLPEEEARGSEAVKGAFRSWNTLINSYEENGYIMTKIGKSAGRSIDILKRPIIRTLRMKDDSIYVDDFNGFFNCMNTKTRRYFRLDPSYEDPNTKKVVQFYDPQTFELLSEDDKKNLGINKIDELFIFSDEQNIDEESQQRKKLIEEEQRIMKAQQEYEIKQKDDMKMAKANARSRDYEEQSAEVQAVSEAAEKAAEAEAERNSGRQNRFKKNVSSKLKRFMGDTGTRTQEAGGGRNSNYKMKVKKKTSKRIR